MCGIGLAWFRQGVDESILEQMLLATEKRGRDAFGCVTIRNGEVLDRFYSPRTYYESGFTTKNLQVDDIVIWNNRARPMTELPSTGMETIQPIVYKAEGLVVVHNGVVANENEKFYRRTKLDSEFFIKRYLASGRNAVKAVEQTVGGSAYIVVDLKREKIIAIRDFKPLGKAYKKGIGYFIMSDREEFNPIFGDMDVAVWEDFYYSDLEPFTVNEIDINSGLIGRITFEPNYISSLPEKNVAKALVLASGGIDSSVAACIAKQHLNRHVTLVHFELGHKSSKGERKAVEYLAEFLDAPLRNIDMQWLGAYGRSVLTDPNLEVPTGDGQNLKNTVCWTPARNLVMVSALMALAEALGAAWIYNGWSLEEEGAYPDNSLDFFRTLNEVANFGTLTRPRVVMLEANLMKPEIVKLGRYFEIDFSRLWSCDTYEGKNECGKCGACHLKRLALEQEKFLDRSVEDILSRVRRW